MPWLDTSPVRSARFRPIYKWVYWLLPIDVIALGYVGSQPPAGCVVTLGQIATFYYFFHFLILMPLIGKLERPRPLPISIAAAVLDGRGAAVRRHGGEALTCAGPFSPRSRRCSLLWRQPAAARAAGGAGAAAASAMVVRRRVRHL